MGMRPGLHVAGSIDNRPVPPLTTAHHRRLVRVNRVDPNLVKQSDLSLIADIAAPDRACRDEITVHQTICSGFTKLTERGTEASGAVR